MKHLITLLIIATAVGLIFILPGCGSGSKSSRDSSSTTPGGTGGSGGGGGGGGNTTGNIPSASDFQAATDTTDSPAPNPDIHISSIDEMFQYLNKCRQDYSFHGRNPNPGAGWAITFTWDDGLAQQAQDRAEELAGGSGPQGSRKSFMLGNMHRGEDMFLTDGPTCKIEALSDPSSAGNATSGGNSGKWHDKGNSAFRMYFCYYDGTGGKMSKLGIGAATASNGGVWWVLQFGQ
ncbi:MAG: hypothetical protein E3J72_07560 [Planctomycetota bacterium]|nr:MAG: hypothetical protein E3J72_07560 [Planctomycetota bacterium]